MKKWLFLILLTIVFAPAPARADVSFFLLESVGVAGEFTGSGHAAIYLSNICTDNGFSLRPCREGESGVVISSYPSFGNGSNYEWMAVPLLPFLYGVEDEKNIPIYANGDVRNFLREGYRKKHLEPIIPGTNDGSLPEGSWKVMLTAAFNRDIYGFTVHTSAAEDIKFLNESNSKPNTGNFGNFTNNCADFARRTLNKYFPGSVGRDWINDFGVTTPKALARSFYRYAKKHPERELSISRFPQVHGSIWRSYDNRNFTEKAFRSKKYLIPSLIFKPSLVAIFSGAYLLTGRFDAHKAYVRHGNRQIARDKRENNRPGMQGVMFFVENNAGDDNLRRPDVPLERLFASKQTWNSHKMTFDSILKGLISNGLFRDEREVRSFFRDLEHQSEPGLDENGQLILKVNAYGQDRILGITRLNLMDGSSDPELALKLVVARIYTDLNAKEKDRSHYFDFQHDWTTMRQLIQEQSSMLKSIDKGRGKFAPNPPPTSSKQRIKKAVIAVTQ
jgi:hypothetical protein